MNDLLRQWRRSLRYTQPSMAQLLGVPVDTLRNWERGTRTPGAVGQAHIILLRWLEKEYPEVVARIRSALVEAES